VAERRNPNKVLFHCEVVRFEEKEVRVAVDVINQTKGTKVQYLVDYVIAADGGKTFGPALGIELAGPRDVADITTIHVKDNLSKYWEEDTMMYWLVDVGGQKNGLGPSPIFDGKWRIFVPMGPTWRPGCKEFGLHLSLAQVHPPVESLTEDDIKRRVRNVLNVPGLEVEVLKASR
jgi:2,4-dichlorophenol 6-monooxygenase